MPCGRPTRGSHPNDDKLPCGTKLYSGSEAATRRTRVLLCDKCTADIAAEEAATAPTL